MSGATALVGGHISLDIDQVGTPTAGSTLHAFVRLMSFARPLEAFLDYGDVR